MLIDARTIPDATAIETDICIVGAGAAGITLARELSGSSLRICLLESGGLDPDPETQDLYVGQNSGRHYYDLDTCRLRFFGGTTNHWSGWCRPLAPIDFEQRPYVPYSGWPFGLNMLEPFYRRAQAVCQLGSFAYDAAFLQAHDNTAGSLPFDDRDLVTEAYQFSPPTRFGEVYRADIRDSKNVSGYLYANVVHIDSTLSRREIARIQAATLNGRHFSVSARKYILATGGIENARLLLSSEIGNQHDLVGRFFMEHPEPKAGMLLTMDPDDPRWASYLYNLPGRGELQPLGFLHLSQATQEREQILSCGIGLGKVRVQSQGWTATRRLLRSAKAGTLPRDFGHDLWGAVSDLGGAVDGAYDRLIRAPETPQLLQVQCFGQQAPNPESRITLGQERDALGLRRPVLHWELAELDKHSIRRTLEIFGQELGRNGLGRLKIDFQDWEPDFYYGNHHMGTTRMSQDPKEGVVDPDCRVHGIDNLFVAGSSVFPTGGTAPPTLTIVALALRLADHLKQAS